MKSSTIYILLLFMTFTYMSCLKKEVPKENHHFLVLNDPEQKKVPDWMKKGTEAWGLVIFSKNEKPLLGKPVHCKIIDISVRGVKCMALEKVSLFDQFNCYKIGIEENEIWFDGPQDIFKTKEEASAYLSDHKLLLK